MFPVDAFRSTVLKVVAIFRKHEIPFHLKPQRVDAWQDSFGRLKVSPFCRKGLAAQIMQFSKSRSASGTY